MTSPERFDSTSRSSTDSSPNAQSRPTLKRKTSRPRSLTPTSQNFEKRSRSSLARPRHIYSLGIAYSTSTTRSPTDTQSTTSSASSPITSRVVFDRHKTSARSTFDTTRSRCFSSSKASFRRANRPSTTFKLSTPHPIDAIFDAAQWILRVPATPRTFPTLSTPTAALLPISSLSSDSAFVKTAQIDAILSTTSHIVAAAISQPDTVQKRTEHCVSPIVPVSATSARIVASISTSATSIASSPTRTTIASVPLSTTRPIEPALYTTSAPASASRPTETETAAAQEHVQALEEEIRQIRTANRYYDDKYTYPRYVMPTIQAPAMLPISNRPPLTFDSVPLSAPCSASIPPPPLTSYMSPSPVASSRSPAVISISPPSKPAVAAAVVKAYRPVVPVPPHSRVVIDTPSSIVAPERIRYRAAPVASIAIATSSSKSSSSNFAPVVLPYTVAAIVASPIVISPPIVASSTVAIVASPIVTIVTSSPIVPPIVTIASPIVMSPIATIVAPVVKPIISNIAVPLVAPPIVASSTVAIVASPIVPIVTSSHIEPSHTKTPALVERAVTSYSLAAISYPLSTIAKTIARLTLRTRPYIRNHARLKRRRLDIVPQ